MSIYAIAMLYVGRKLDKIRLYDTEANKIELVDPTELKKKMKKNEVTIPNLTLDGTKFASHKGDAPRVTKVVDGSAKSPIYRVAVAKIGELGYKYVSYEGYSYLRTLESMEEFVDQDLFSNIAIISRYGEVEISNLSGKLEVCNSGNMVTSEILDCHDNLWGYKFWINNKVEIFSCRELHTTTQYLLSNAELVRIEHKGYAKRVSLSLKVDGELSKIYLVPEKFYRSVYGSEVSRTLCIHKNNVIITKSELQDLQKRSGIADIDLFVALSDTSNVSGDTEMYRDVINNAIKEGLTDTSLAKLRVLEKRKIEDDDESPWMTDKWSKKFIKANKASSHSIKEAPFNTLLVSTAYQFSPIYPKNSDRGTGLDIYSLIIKLSDDLIYCVSGTYWGVSSSGTSSYSFGQSGFFEYTDKTRDGEFRPLKDIDVLEEVKQVPDSTGTVPVRNKESMTKLANELSDKYKAQGFKMLVMGSDDHPQICVRYIGDSSVTELKIPEGVTSMSRMSLTKAPNLTRIHLPSSLEQIGEALHPLNELAVITSDSKQVLAEDCVVFEKNGLGIRLVFYSRVCKNSFYNVPEYVTDIADSAFCENSYIQIVDIKNKVTVNNKCFAGCTSLREITFRNINLFGGKFTFKGTKFESVRMENGYPISLGFETFADCPKLMFAMFSDVEVIGNHSFINCPKLSTLVFCNIERFKVSPRDAFSNCPMLETIYLPDFMRGTDIAQNFESAYKVEYYNTDCNDCFGRIAHDIMHKAENQSIVHAENVVEKSDKDILATNVKEITNLSVKAYKVSHLKYNGETVGYRLTLQDLTRRDISREVGDTLDFGNYKIEYNVTLVQDGDELVSKTEKATGKRVRDISDDIKLCHHYAKDIKELG